MLLGFSDCWSVYWLLLTRKKTTGRCPHTEIDVQSGTRLLLRRPIGKVLSWQQCHGEPWHKKAGNTLVFITRRKENTQNWFSGACKMKLFYNESPWILSNPVSHWNFAFFSLDTPRPRQLQNEKDCCWKKNKRRITYFFFSSSNQIFSLGCDLGSQYSNLTYVFAEDAFPKVSCALCFAFDRQLR